MAHNYWKVLKSRLVREGSEAVTNCNRLTALVIFRWLSTRYRGFMGLWEKCNMDFNVTEFRNIGNESGSARAILVKKVTFVTMPTAPQRSVWPRLFI